MTNARFLRNLGRQGCCVLDRKRMVAGVLGMGLIVGAVRSGRLSREYDGR